MNEIMVNRIPSLTWNWLHMNETKISSAAFSGEGAVTVKVPETVLQKSSVRSSLENVEGGMGADVETLARQSGVSVLEFSVPAGEKETRTAALTFSYGEGDSSLNRIDLIAKENSAMTVLMDLGGGRDGQALVQTKLHVEKNAKITLAQVLRPGKQFALLDDVGICCEEDGVVELIMLVLGEGDAYLGVRDMLKGKNSSLESDLCYLLDGAQRLDVNYVADHFGKKTQSRLDASGVLRGNSRKLFRGTIDFKNGSAGSKGDEKEDVLLLSDSVVNQTIPLILCHEEDVEGNHGATIGNLDEKLLFYLTSRGIREEDVYEMLAKARADALCRKIPDGEWRAKIRGYAGIAETEENGGQR